MTQKIHRYISKGKMLCGESHQGRWHYTATEFPGIISCEKCRKIEAKRLGKNPATYMN